MQRSSRPDVLDLQHNSKMAGFRDRSRSVSSIDNPLSSSCSTSSLNTNPLINISPAPGYIASSAATLLVTNDHEHFFQSLQEDGILGPEPPVMCVAEPSLKLVNEFLDFLLYTFLATAKSTSLAALRPAVTEVLRQRLAKEAVGGADEELTSYLGTGSDAAVDADAGASPSEWDLEMTWRKVRVQCMVYSSLGDLEEDDEIFYSEQSLDPTIGSDNNHHPNRPVEIPPAVAIWLTSILEYIGEQTLLVAGHATIARYSVQRIAAAASNDATLATSNADVTFPERPMVEDHDTEKVALNPSLGRMWRQWRKKLRGARGSISLPQRDGSNRSAPDRPGNPTTQVNQNTVELNLAALPSFVLLAQPKGPELLTAPKSGGLAVLEGKDVLLTPIVESSTPRIAVTVSPSSGVGHQELASFATHSNDRDNGQRPRSLIFLPFTNVPPFTLAPGLDNSKKHRSLPELKRGDFADPDTEAPLGIEQNTAIQTASTECALTGSRTSVNGISPHALSLAQTSASLPEPIEQAQGPVELDAQAAPSTSTAPLAEDSGCTTAHYSAQDPVSDSRRSLPSIQTSLQQPGAQVSPTARCMAPGEEVSPENSPVRATELGDLSPVSDIESTPAVSLIRNDNIQQEHNSRRTPPRTGFAGETDSRDFVQATTTLKPTVNHLEEIKRSSHMKTLSSSSKHSQLSDRKIGQLTLVQTSGSSHSDRAGGVRVFTPPTTPDRTRRSSSFSKLQRPTHTSGSTSSQTSTKLKNLLPWQNDAGKHTKLSESDTESRSSLHSDRLTTLDDKERSFEELISGGGTIHCTITPDPIRNMEINKVSKTRTSELADFFRNTGPDRRAGPSTHSKTVTSVSNVTRTLNNTSMPRPSTARHIDVSEHESLSQSAQLIDSSGPTGSVPRNSNTSRNREAPSLPTAQATTIQTRPYIDASIDVLPAVVRQNAPESPTSAARSRSRLLAREASGSTGSDTTSALADFFRNTNPPTDGDAGGNRRISRSVAPFRNTMDSTQFDPTEETDSRMSEDHRLASSNFGVTPNPHESYQSSYNSSTALLRSSSRGRRDFGGAASAHTGSTDGPQIQRKQVRNKDPYAIDDDLLDDEDDEYEFESLDLILPKKREEESLMDFLNSAPPPPPQPTVPFETNIKTVQKKQSAVSLMNRFGRSHRKNSISVSERSVSHQAPAAPVKHVPLRVDMDSVRRDSQSQFGQPNDNNRYNSNDQYVPRSGGRITRPAQARGGRVDTSGTDSLADFLKNTGPPEQRLQHLPHKEESSKSVFKKMGFSRSSKKFSGMV